MPVTETDYLVVGAGASGMAFVDALIAASEAEVVMVDRRHRPGGHCVGAPRIVVAAEADRGAGTTRTAGSRRSEPMNAVDQLVEHLKALPRGPVTDRRALMELLARACHALVGARPR